MAVKRTGQLSFVDALLQPGGRPNDRLDRLNELVKWGRFEQLIAHLRNPESAGRPGYLPLAMFKALLLAALYGLSDAETEAALCDRLSFRRFLGLSLADDVPDHTTLCRFRNLLVEDDLLEQLFAELDRQLEEAGLILKRGTMLDATVIETAAARPPGKGDEPTDPDAGFGKRTGRAGFTYGYKAHVGADQGSGLIRAVRTTPANVNDTTPADELIRGDEAAVYADAAYHTHAREAALRDRKIKPRLMRRPNKHHPRLPRRIARMNRLIARRRAPVETTFATWKRRMGFTAIRYLGLAKAHGQVVLVAMAFNMRRWCALAN
jgi:transposase, IS5 family